KDGILWPDALAPFQVALVPLNNQKSPAVQEAADKLYQALTAAGVEVIYDDRKERPGVKFSDMELIGIPHRIVISDSGIEKKAYEYKHRRTGEKLDVPADSVIEFLLARLRGV
ncbi:MAG TPA: His/Gly/Thr/Pro-type tRNA ligase C-terminal domain-containing protein, partial [Dongiaceae bacterium]|nr:His/Gly/Thr/Pro-type tRNA ligase C-terminal domain-containing protein [Dongiaceae bacterium]